MQRCRGPAEAEQEALRQRVRELTDAENEALRRYLRCSLQSELSEIKWPCRLACDSSGAGPESVFSSTISGLLGARLVRVPFLPSSGWSAALGDYACAQGHHHGGIVHLGPRGRRALRFEISRT